MARFDKNTGWPQPTTAKESHAAEVSPPQNRHGLGVLVKYRHPAMKSMSVNACFRQRSASYWPATSPCAREGFHPRRKVVGIRVEALIELIQFVGLFRSGCAPGSATGISCLRISVSTGADIVGKRMSFASRRSSSVCIASTAMRPFSAWL